ncbi:hypothetical protein AZE42_12605 [Rhizopogon vesiculosus]|uniref:Uncharacterized protein n=1 Tax=Rhizopogon vesiculosus TaxID=180088 RepID=A0A1J8QQ51_9AGAM|nr:hypothetical protein AZE42_12605 [Rhizopogon vesiculosus]
MTAHWIAKMEETNTLCLKGALITFHRLHKKHTGKSLARTVLHLLDRADATLKVGHFTLDNVENNVTFMEELAQRLTACDIPFDAKD